MTKQDWGAALRQVRESKGHSQADVAYAVGADEDTVGRWERGERRPQGRKLRPLLAFYGELAQ